MVYDRCSAAVSGMHGAFSDSDGIYGGGSNRGEGLDENILDRPADRASALWKFMRESTQKEVNNGRDSRRCDWNYLGAMRDDPPGGGGGGASSNVLVHRGQGGAGGLDWRKRSLSQISRMCGSADGHQMNGGIGCSMNGVTGAKMSNAIDSSIRYEVSSFAKRTRLDEPEMALSEASTRMDA